MAFVTLTDGTANIPSKLKGDIIILPCNYDIDDEHIVYDGNLDNFNCHEYYEKLRSGSLVKTTLLNMQTFIESFRPILESGSDIVYTAMSSGISGTYQAAKLAATTLMEEFPERTIHIVDSLTCGLGNGMLAIYSSYLNKIGTDIKKASQILDERVSHCCSYFTVDDLNHLKRTGRVTGATAAISTLLNIKPILFGSSEGKIISCNKVRGRRKSIEELVNIIESKIVDPENNFVFISHGDCLSDAKLLAEKIKEKIKAKDIIIAPHEPFSGGHVGPGMLGLFFYGSER